MRDAVNGPIPARGDDRPHDRLEDRRRLASAWSWPPADDPTPGPAAGDPALCEPLRRDLELWLEGELADPARSSIVRAHVRSCVECAERAREYDELTREILASEAGPDSGRLSAGAIADRLLRELSRASRRSGGAPLAPRLEPPASRRGARRLRAGLSRLAAAAALILAGFWLAIAWTGVDPGRPASTARRPGGGADLDAARALVASDWDGESAQTHSARDRLVWLLRDRAARGGTAPPGRLQLHGIRSGLYGRARAGDGVRPEVEWVVDAAWTPWAARRPGLRFYLVPEELVVDGAAVPEPRAAGRVPAEPERFGSGRHPAGLPEIIPVSWFSPDQDDATSLVVAGRESGPRLYRVWVVNDFELPDARVPDLASDPGEVLRALRGGADDRWSLEPGPLR